MSGMPWDDFAVQNTSQASGPWNDFKTNPQDNSVANNLAVAKTAFAQASNLDPVNQLKAARQRWGGDIASVGGYLGGKVASAGIPQWGISPSPIAGNLIQGAGVVGGAIPAIGPEILSAYTSAKGLFNPQNPIAAGLTNTPKGLSPQYTAQNQAIGISNEIPETASKVQYDNPYQYASQLAKPKYVPVQQPELPVVEGGATSGDPHALFSHTDQFGENGQPRNVYQIFGDKGDLGPQWGTHLPEEQLGDIPVTGRTPSSMKFDPTQGPQQFQPVENPNAPAFTRPKLSYPADTGPGAAQPLPSTVPTKYPSDPGALINQANARVNQFGEQLTPQELSDYHQLIGTKIANGEIPKFDPTTGKVTPLFAQASQTQAKITQTLNQVAEPRLAEAAQSGKLPPNMLQTRAGLNQAYGISQIPGKIAKGAVTIGKYGTGAATGLATLYGIYQGYKRLTGQ